MQRRSVAGQPSQLSGKPPTMPEIRLAANDPVQEMVHEYGYKKMDYASGDSFGERALIDSSRRSATILTNEECEFLIVAKKDFLMIKDRFDGEKIQKKDFLWKNIPEMSQIHASSVLDYIMYSFKDHILKKGYVLMRQGQHDDKIYWLQEGQLRVESSVLVGKYKKHDKELDYYVNVPVAELGELTEAFYQESD
jgi:hypothetical protein